VIDRGGLSHFTRRANGAGELRSDMGVYHCIGKFPLAAAPFDAGLVAQYLALEVGRWRGKDL